MKLLKKQWLTVVLLATLILTLSLGVFFLMPSRTAKADEDVFVAEKEFTVTTGDDLNAKIKEAGPTPTRIILDDDIVLTTSEVWIERGQSIAIDLKGHTLSRNSNWVIVNMWGNLYLEDSSAEKTGTIAAATDAYFAALVWNYGKVVSNVNYDIKYSTCVAVKNELRFGSDNEYVCNPSLTIKGGKFYHKGSNGNSIKLLEVIDGDVTITDGTFIVDGVHGQNTSLMKVSSTMVPGAGGDIRLEWGTDLGQDPDGGLALTPTGQEKVSAEVERIRSAFAAYNPYRHSKIKIDGGDFTSFGPECVAMDIVPYLVEYIDYHYGKFGPEWITETKPYDVSVAITGGKWGKDLPGYAADGYWMEYLQETSSSGYYQVVEADQNKAEASVTVDGKVRYYPTFDAAFAATKATAAEQHTIALLKNATTKNLNLENVKGDIVLDLHGHKLKVDPENAISAHVTVSSNDAFQNRFIICDKSEEQNGELELCASSSVGLNSFFCFNTSNTKVVLESGTIRQTGLIPAVCKDYAIGTTDRNQVKALYNMSLFKLAPNPNGVSIPDRYKTEFPGTVIIKGGNIISELSFGTADNIVDTHPGVLVGFMNTSGGGYQEFGLKSKSNDEVSNKEEIIKLDLKAYLEDGSRVCKFSWDVKDIVSSQGLACNQSKDGCVVSNVVEGQNFIVGSSGNKVSTLKEALEKAQENDTISVLQNATVTEAVTIDRGITLNLNAVVNFELTFTQGFTLLGGASIRYGNIISQEPVTVSGDATLESLTLNGDIIVSGGTLSIPSGTYNGEFTINGDATLAISGGSFKGSQITKLDKFFDKYLGAFDEENKFDYEGNPDKLYSLKFGPNLQAQAWYNKFSGNEYTIGSTDDWLSFSLFVNGGIDSFANKIVKLIAELDFDPNAASGVALAAEVAEPNFMPAGNAINKFAGTFDGNKLTIKNIVAQEYFVGLFGHTAGTARFNNITLKDCSFMVGSGDLDAFFPAGSHTAAGAIVGEGFMYGNQEGTDWSGNFTIDNVKVGVARAPQAYNGGIIGHSWGDVKIDGVTFLNETTVGSNFKKGGVVGYLDGEFYIKDADIEQGTEGKKNGLVLDENDGCIFGAGILVGHAHNLKNTVENCTVLEHNRSLFGSLYVTSAETRDEGDIVIKGKETELDIYRVVGASRPNGNIEVELTQEVTEEGTSRGSVKLQAADNGLQFYEGEGETRKPIEVQPDENGSYTATAKLNVTIGGITETSFTYSGTLPESVTFETFVLYDELGRVLSNEEYAYLGTFTVTATLRTSDYGVGEKVLLVTSYTVSGEGAKNYNFLTTGNQAFITITVNPTTLTVRVNGNGEVEYEGFVGGEDESVLGGTLTLEKVDNGDGTYTVTPSGFESENYNIVYVSGIVSAPAGTGASTPDYTLWIILGTLAAVAVVCGTVAIVCIRRKRD